MKVKGKQTEVKNVEIDVELPEIISVVSDLRTDILFNLFSNSVMRKFTEEVVAATEPVFPLKKYHISQNALYHTDAGYDYHNNVGVDKKIRDLTQEEIKKNNHLQELLEDISLYANT